MYHHSNIKGVHKNIQNSRSTNLETKEEFAWLSKTTAEFFQRKQKARVGVVENINANMPPGLQLGILAYY